MRALPSSSRDLPLLLPEWMLFALLQMAACRTLEMLARGTGLRGDATRAPMQVRNGWRPHRRHLTQPASPSKDEPIFCPNDGVHLTLLIGFPAPLEMLLAPLPGPTTIAPGPGVYGKWARCQ